MSSHRVGDPHDIAFPEGFARWPRERTKMVAAREARPWGKRKGELLFRGQIAGHRYSASNMNKVEHLAKL